MEDTTGKDKVLLTTLVNAAKDRDNILDIIVILQPGDLYQGLLITVNEYVKFLQDKIGRTVSDATVRNLIQLQKIDGIYKRNSTNIKYLILLTDKTKNYKPRQYTKK